MLTNAAVKAARPKAAAYKLWDERGLHLHVAPSGHRAFRLKFRFGGRESLLTIGDADQISLNQARALRDAARELLERGADPRVQSALAPGPDAGDTFEAIARRWHDHRRARWSIAHAEDVLDSLALHVFPAIGAQRLSDITASDVLDVLQSIEVAGAIETARRIRQRISAVFGFAIVRKLAKEDPAASLTRELGVAPAVKHHPALLDAGSARALFAAADATPASPATRLAAQLLALTAVRLAAVRGATWSEFEDLDVPGGAIWRIPAARMKLAKAKKADPSFEHIVPLSAPAVDALRAARAIAGPRINADELVFVGRAGTRPISEAAIGEMYERAGFAGRHTPHGWRASFSTILNERFPDDQGAIDRALAHAPKNKVEAAYNRAQHLAKRRELFQRWGEILADFNETAGSQKARAAD